MRAASESITAGLGLSRWSTEEGLSVDPMALQGCYQLKGLRIVRALLRPWMVGTSLGLAPAWTRIVIGPFVGALPEKMPPGFTLGTSCSTSHTTSRVASNGPTVSGAENAGAGWRGPVIDTSRIWSSWR